MKPIDLAQFAEHSTKIPSTFLTTTLSSEHSFKWYEIFATHLIDLFIVTRVYTIARLTLKSSLYNLMNTESLHDAFQQISFKGMNYSLLAVLMITYFFSCYFLNQGQTLGMKFLNRRVSMDTHSAKSAWRWTCYSMSLYFSCGLIAAWGHQKLVASGFGAFSKNDHFYLKLMTYKSWSIPELPMRIQEEEVHELPEKIAA